MVDFSGILKRLPTRDSVLAAVDRVPAVESAASPFVAGDSVASMVAAVADVTSAGMAASVAYLPDPAARESARLAHVQVIDALSSADLSVGSDLLVGLDALAPTPGSLAGPGRDSLAALCGAARDAGMTVTLDTVGFDRVDEVLAARSALAEEHPDLGVTLAAFLHRTEGDCLVLAEAGARVRLVKRDGDAPAGHALSGGHEVDKAYVRCLRLLVGAGARTTVATHDDRLVEIASALAARAEREPGHLVHQFRRGVATERVAELVAAGAAVQVLVPFGPGWAGYVTRYIGLSPASLGSAARAALGRSAT